MSYMTAMASSPVYEFPYSGSQIPAISFANNDIDSILASIAPPVGGTLYNQSPSCTLQCVPQISSGIGNNATVYQVPDNVPLEAILQQFGIDTGTLQPSGSLNNYYRSMPQPIETRFRSPQRGRRRLICQEVSDSEDDLYYRHPSHRHRRHSDPWPNRQQQSPPAIHNLLNNVWHKAERATKNVPPSYSTPNLNSQWQSMPNRPPSPPPVSQAQQKAVNSVWNRAQNSSGQNTNFISNVFDRMRQPTGNIIQPSPPPPQNREAVQDFFATRNLPYGLNQPPPPQNREAVGNFNAARNLPYGLNQPPPPQNREAVGNFIAARNLPYNYNRPPPQQNPEAERNFIAARNVPSGINRPNSAAQNVWNRADYAANNAPPPMFNTAWNQMQSSPPPMNSPWNQMQSSPPPMNSPWNQMQQSAPYPQNPTRILAPFAGSIRPPTRVPAPPSFAGILSQAHSQHSPYAGSM